MNTTTAVEQNALTLPQRAAVALGSSKTEADLHALVTKSADIVEVNNMAGRDQAHRIGMDLKTARVLIEKTGKAAREDATAFSKAVIAEEKRLVEIITPEEDRVFALRDGWDTKVENERQAKIAAEAERMGKIASAIDGIRERETDAIRKCKTAADTQIEIDGLEQLAITKDVYQERFDEAVTLKATVLESMRTVLAGRVAAEAAEVQRQAEAAAEAARVAAERVELEALRAAAAEQARLAKIESDRVAAEQAVEAKRLADLAEAQDREARVKAETAAADLRALAAAQVERERVAAQVKAQLEAQAAQLAADRKAFEDERAAEAKAKADAEAAKATVAVDPPPVSEEQGADSVAPAATWPWPCLRLGQISERLGFALTADFLRGLGFEPAARDKAAMLYHERDFPSICAALIRHISAAQAKQAA
jgi:hypothetical protein